MKLHQAESIKIMKKRGSRGMHFVAEREREGAVVPHRDLLPSAPGDRHVAEGEDAGPRVGPHLLFIFLVEQRPPEFREGGCREG
jgi:hypothetical protein